MANVYSSRFGVWKDETASGLLNPVPGTVWVLREITLFNGNDISLEVQFGLFDEASDATLVYYAWPAPGTGQYQVWSGRLVVPETAGIYWQAISDVGTPGLDVSMSGYVLTLP